VTLSAGVKPAAVTQKAPVAPVVVDAPVINDIVVSPVAPTAEVEQPAATVSPPPIEPAQDWPITVTVRNNSRAFIVCPVCGMYSAPASLHQVSLHDAEHARAVTQNIRDLAARQNVSAEIVITGLPDGL
jgi:hypothetical protein